MNKPGIIFSMLGSIMTIVFFYIINCLYSFNHIWFIYPAFCILWWPISLFYNAQKRYKEYSIVSSVLIIAFLIATNYTTSSSYPWFLYAIFPVIWWPISMLIGRKAGTIAYALFVSFCTIAYYALLNYLLYPHYAWAIYPAFAILWWPLSLYYARKKQFLNFSLIGSLFIILFFGIVNLISTPNTLWAIYPAFAILWWPISLYYGEKKEFSKFSFAGSFLTILFFILVNHITTPHTPWAIYPSLAVLWWPLTMYFVKRKDFYSFSIAASMLMILFFIIVNVITTPNRMWAVYPSFGIIWWPLCMHYKKSKDKLNL